MYLKRLEMFGFKSFADRSSFDFEPGVACLVGPNGCGKSNVVDALKWVMGEQSAKSLRGKEMTDVIFNGTSSRKPLGYAEVALTFDNNDRSLPIEYDEVTIGRRLYRDGTSEYFVNKQLCRLRDLRELFMDTGMGVRSYSVIEQGKVDILLQASSKERRLVFEEAAGISRYRTHKLNALRRLERVEKNLEVLRAYVGEVEKQLRSVVRQANRARRWKDLSETLRDKRAVVALADYVEAHAGLEEATQKVAQLTEQETAQSSEAARLSARISETEAAALPREERRREAEQERAAVGERLAQIETDTAVSRRTLEQLDEQLAGVGSEAEALQQQLQEQTARVGELQTQIVQGEDREHELQQALAGLTEEAEATRVRVEELEQQLNASRAQLVEDVRRRSQLENKLAGLDAERRALGARRFRVEQRSEFTAAREKEISTEREDLQQRRQEAQTRTEELTHTVAEMKTQRGEVEQRVAALDEQIAHTRTDLGAVNSRLGLLEDLERRYEGISAGVRGLLSALQEGSAPFSGQVAGLVADLITVTPDFTPAIEAALGDEAQAIVTQDTATALSGADWLAQAHEGRATFRPLDQARRRWVDLTALLGDPRIVGVASSLVTVDEAYYPLVQALLGHVLVVQDRDAALALAESAQRAGAALVTLAGERFEPEGAITAGARQAEALGLLSRKNEITRQRESRDQLQTQLEALRAQRMDGETQAAEQTARIEDLSDQRADASQLAANLETQLAALAREGENLAVERERLDQELSNLDSESESLENQASELTTERDTLAEREATARRTMAAAEDKLTLTRNASGELATRLSDTRVAHTQAEAGLARLRGELARAQSDTQEAEARIADHGRRTEEARSRREEVRQVIEESTKQLEELTARRDGLEKELSRIAAEAEESRVELDNLRQAERETNNRLREAQQALSEARLNENSLRMRLDHLVQTTQRELGRDLAQEYEARLQEAREAEEQQDQDGEEGGAPTFEVTTELREEIRELQEQIEKLGVVNVAAIDEEMQLRERADFLGNQKQDLERARNSLKDVVARLNRRSRLLFQETFMHVQKNFQELFRKLFGGGRAELRLEDHEDVLEAGIEIIARPPGKQPRSLTLLSGGEKTMTTIALLFAIFKSKPSPLCVLDEVDAPLDEANVDRFNLIVQEFLDTSQFLIITHNKRTMTYASTIFGVTQEEAGVSKKITVKLEEVDHHLQVAD